MSGFQLTEAQTGVDGNIFRLIDPAEIPTPGGDAEALEQAAADLRSGGEEILEFAEGAESTWSGLDAHYEAPESGELLAAMEPTVERAEDVESDLTTVADALDDFASAIRTAKNSLDSLRAQAEELRAEVDADSAFWWAKKPSAITRNMDLKDAVNRAWRTYNDAEIECANTISGLCGGPTYVAPDAYTGGLDEIPYGLATDAGQQNRGFTDFAGRYFGDSYAWMREGDDAPWPLDWAMGFSLGSLETIVVDIGWETGVSVVSLLGFWGPNTGWTLNDREVNQNTTDTLAGSVQGIAGLVGLHGEDGWLINPFGDEPYWGYDRSTQWTNLGAAWAEEREAFFAWSEWGENDEYAAGVTVTNLATLPVSGTLRVVRLVLSGGRRGGADGPDGDRQDVDTDADGFASLDPDGGSDGRFESVDELLENLDEDPTPDGRVEDLMPDLDTGPDGGAVPTPNPSPSPTPNPSPTPSPEPRPSVGEPRQDGPRTDPESEQRRDGEAPNVPGRESGSPDTPVTSEKGPQGGDTDQPRTEETTEQRPRARNDDDTYDDQVDDGPERRGENQGEPEPVRPREEPSDQDPSPDSGGDDGGAQPPRDRTGTGGDDGNNGDDGDADGDNDGDDRDNNSSEETGSGNSDSDSSDYQSPEPGSEAYESRIEELMDDPAKKNDNPTQHQLDKARREAEVGLAAERQGLVPGPIQRAEIDNSDPAFQQDQGDIVDASGQAWDIKGFRDTFPSGPRAGQPMPPGMRGGFDINRIESEIRNELNNGESVLLDISGISTPENLSALRELIENNPEWDGKVVIVEEGE
ncbi:hypothetical protein [Nocardiopsis sp. FIRDI 009]|uniref:hypothetical protein n=1 Tax=Nocardiopsis sp. FIRDI 009 TaxID=714197 RepID=UPI000E2268FF|nr:hypothetical protein [Nocardiopsis sp. FIRDI 009]